MTAQEINEILKSAELKSIVDDHCLGKMVGEPEVAKYIARINLVESAAAMIVSDARQKVFYKLGDLLNTEELSPSLSMDLVKALNHLRRHVEELKEISALRSLIVPTLLGEVSEEEEAADNSVGIAKAPKRSTRSRK